MSKSTLQAGLVSLATKGGRSLEAKQPKGAKANGAKKNGARANTVLIGGHFDPAVKSTLLSIRVEHPQLTTQNLLEEALDLLFERYKKPQTARLARVG